MPFSLRLPRTPAVPVIGAAVVIAAALAAVGAAEYRATERELSTVLHAQAISLHDTVLAAARTNAAAADEAERQLSQRLLDNVRLLQELDRRGALTPALLDEVVRRHGLFRAAMYDADGERQVGPDPGDADDAGGRGPGFGGGRLLDRLLAGEGSEAVTDVHRSRWGDPRVAAGIRRADGGAIVLNADATAVDALQRAYSLDALLAAIAASNPEVAYVALEDGASRLVHGAGIDARLVPAAEPGAPPVTRRVLTVAGRPVFEVAGPAPLNGSTSATLRLGMRLDALEAARRQTITRLALSLTVMLALTLVALGFVGLRRRYGELSDRHARAQEALRRRDRLAAMGELASTVAHEVRNPLNAIAMSAQRLRREFAPPIAPADAPEFTDLVAVVEGEARRLDGTVQQFLEYARPRPLVRRPVEIDGLLGAAVDAVRALATARDVRIDVSAARGLVWVDPDQFRQALDNLLRNAIEATPPAGAVSIGATLDAHTLVVEVRDTGHGIAPDHLPRIFDLYFTTKPHGTGVGLAVTHQIVTAHGGTIEAESTPGPGTRMIVRLPRERDRD